MCSYRNINVTVKRAAEESAALFFYTHHAEGQATNFQSLSKRILVREKLLFNVRAQHNHERGALDFIIRDEASGFDGFVFDVDHVCRVTKDLRTRKFNSILFKIRAAAHAGAHFSTGGAMVAHPLVVVPIQSLIPSIASFKLFIVHVPGERHSRDHEMVAAEHLRDLVDDVGVETAN